MWINPAAPAQIGCNRLPPGDGRFGSGHDQASGGSLPIARWNELLGHLGFAPSAFAPDGQPAPKRPKRRMGKREDTNGGHNMARA